MELPRAFKRFKSDIKVEPQRGLVAFRHHSKMVCEKCETKLSKVIVPDKVSERL